MLYRSYILSITLCLSCPIMYTSTDAIQIEENDKQDITQKILDQSQRIYDYLTHVQEYKAYSEKEALYCIENALATAPSTRKTPEELSKQEVVNILNNNRLRARQLYEVATCGKIFTDKDPLPPYINAESAWHVLHEVYEATQEMTNSAISQLENSYTYNYVYALATENPIATTGALSSLAAGAALTYYYWDTQEIVNTLYNILEADISFGNNIRTKDLLYRGACAFGALTAWVRYRTLHEIENYEPEIIKTWLQTYKQALHSIGFPGNTHKLPVAQTIADDLPDAQEFKKMAKSRGYNVHEDRIPGDIIDLKIWKINILDAALITAASNCIKNDFYSLFSFNAEANEA